MSDRIYLEQRPNFVATIKVNRKVRHKFRCLMKDIHGGFYWEIADYKGMFTWGAICELSKEEIKRNLCNGVYTVVKGYVPYKALTAGR